ncbi:hypothetical protein GCM10023092_12670 [Rurimicrobium arvi]|uniref:SbsA Ig-like domain-containing protein n=2 Tax=Rurimicrobium arvi TaxID=2049916 RepID=A0ABP8MNV6_9BACT
MALHSVSEAQLPLSGSVYRQNFDSLVLGLPKGWYADTNARTAYRGGAAAGVWVPGTTTRWSSTGGSFKNVASANSFRYWADATTTLQLTATDRALGLRQTSTFGDPGASFAVRIDQTYKLTDFRISFKLQSLDSANGSKITPWVLQYGWGDSPDTFYTVPGSIMGSGGSRYANDRYVFSFGKALDDSRGPVWIRIAALAGSGGSGSRTITALDDVELLWNGTAISGARPYVQHTVPASNAKDVQPGSILRISFSKGINKGSSGNLYIKNESSGTIQTISIGSPDVVVTGKEMAIAGVRLQPYSDYHVTFDSSVADTAGFACIPLSDTSDWRFSTVPATAGKLPELFDTVCLKPLQPSGWQQYSKQGVQVWSCHEAAAANQAMYIYGYDGSLNVPNSDWLISPLYDLSSVVGTASEIHVRYRKSGPGNILQLFLSENYVGSGDPDSALWVPAGWIGTAATAGVWSAETIRIPAGYEKSKCYLGFHYISDATEAQEVWLDSLDIVPEPTGLAADPQTESNRLRVENPVAADGVMRLFLNTAASGAYEIAVHSMTGTCVFRKQERFTAGSRVQTISDVFLSPGTYIISVSGEGQQLRSVFVKGK